MMKSKLISFSILSLLLATSCGGKTETKEDTADEKKPLVKVETVDFRPVVQEGHYTATVEPELINNISAASPNRIKQILVDEGIRVSKGQKLVVMDDVNTTSYELQVANAKANLENVQLNYDRAVELLKSVAAPSRTSTRCSSSSRMPRMPSHRRNAASETCRRTPCSSPLSTAS